MPKLTATIKHVIHHSCPQDRNSMALLVEMEIKNKGGDSCAEDFRASLVNPGGVVVVKGQVVPVKETLVFKGIEGISRLEYSPDKALQAHAHLIRRGAHIEGILWFWFAPFWLRVFSETLLRVTFKDVKGKEWAATFPLIDSKGTPNMVFAV